MKIAEKSNFTACVEITPSVGDKNYMQAAIENIIQFGLYTSVETVMTPRQCPTEVFTFSEDTMEMAIRNKDTLLDYFKQMQLVRVYPANSDYINGINFRHLYAARARSIDFCETQETRDEVFNTYIPNILENILGKRSAGYKNECGEDMVIFYDTLETVIEPALLDNYSAEYISLHFPENNRRDLLGNLQKVVDKIIESNGTPMHQNITVLPANIIGQYINLDTLEKVDI